VLVCARAHNVRQPPRFPGGLIDKYPEGRKLRVGLSSSFAASVDNGPASLGPLVVEHIDRSPVFPRAAAEGFAARDVNVILYDNRWVEPPADVLRMGMAYAASFLKDLDGYGRIWSNRLKVVLVGLANAGKTSVAIRLQGRASSAPLPAVEERTVGVEIRDVQLGRGPADDGSGENAELDVKLWDFAGQRAYYDTHQVRNRLG